MHYLLTQNKAACFLSAAISATFRINTALARIYAILPPLSAIPLATMQAVKLWLVDQRTSTNSAIRHDEFSGGTANENQSA